MTHVETMLLDNQLYAARTAASKHKPRGTGRSGRRAAPLRERNKALARLCRQRGVKSAAGLKKR